MNLIKVSHYKVKYKFNVKVERELIVSARSKEEARNIAQYEIETTFKTRSFVFTKTELIKNTEYMIDVGCPILPYIQ